MNHWKRAVSKVRAEELVQSGHWMYGSVVRRTIMNEAQRKASEFAGLGLRPSPPDFTFLNKTLGEAQSVFAELVEHYEIEQPPIDSRTIRQEIPVREHSVFKIGPTLHEGLFKILGIVIAIVGTTKIVSPAGILTVGVAVREFIQVIVAGWETITDPHEKLVFEALLTLHGKCSVVNYDAYEREDYSKAFGYLWPTESEVISYCTSIAPEETRRAFAAMEQRNIVTAERSRWSIRL